MPPYTKPALTPARLVGMLQSRGLIIRDIPRAERYINNIGYYRLSAYCMPFYSPGAKTYLLPGQSLILSLDFTFLIENSDFLLLTLSKGLRLPLGRQSQITCL